MTDEVRKVVVPVTESLWFFVVLDPIAASAAASHIPPLAPRISLYLMERREIPVTTQTVLMS